MTPHDLLNYLMAMLHGNFWKPYRFLDEGRLIFTDWLSAMRPVSAGLLVLFLVLEFLRRKRGALESGDVPFVGLLTWSALLGVFLVSVDVYWFGTHLLVEIGGSVSRALNNAAMDAIDMEITNLLKGLLQSTQNPLSFFSALLEMMTPIGLLTVTSYWIVIALLFVIPLLQSLYIALFVLLGPLLLPFALWEPTRRVAKMWLLSLLGSAFISVFGIIAYTAISISGILTNLASAGENHILSLVYSFTTIAFLVAVPWASYRLFGALSPSIQEGLSLAMRHLQKLKMPARS